MSRGSVKRAKKRATKISRCNHSWYFVGYGPPPRGHAFTIYERCRDCPAERKRTETIT